MVESGELGAEPWQQRVPTVSAALDVDGDTGRGERFDITHDGAGGDLEFLGQDVRGQLATLTQQQDQRHQPVSAHGMDATEYLTQGVVIQRLGGDAPPNRGDARTRATPDGI